MIFRDSMHEATGQLWNFLSHELSRHLLRKAMGGERVA